MWSAFAVNVLAFDTCFSSCSVAISVDRDGGAPRIEAEHCDMETGHAEALIPMIERVAARAGIALSQIDRIVVTNGPGTFTGIRTGVAVARALALATGAEIVAVSSLWAIATRMLKAGMIETGVLERGSVGAEVDALIVAMDARKGQLYAQVIDCAGRELSEPQLLDAEQVAGLFPALRVAIAGTGATAAFAAAQAAGRKLFQGGPATFSASPDAKHLLAAADRSSIAGPLLPQYLRPPDAKPQADKSLPWSTT
jgi:tRNA threonylcarbamoyladenosine biosynthesis protein TsaB